MLQILVPLVGVAYGSLAISSESEAKAATAETDATAYAWRSTEKYTPPNFEAHFPDDEEGGKRLDALFRAVDRDARPDEEILQTVRQGLRRTRQHRTLVLAWIGNRYIWNKSPQHPDAIEIMYHAADFSGPHADPYGTRYYAVYFGLSVVERKTPAILRTLVDLCLRVDDPNDLGRVAWGAASQRAELLELLQPHLKSKDKATRQKAAVLEKIFKGELEAFAWAREQARQRALVKYGQQLPRIKADLAEGDSETRRDVLKLIAAERITLIMDDSFVKAFATCAEDEDRAVREQVAILVGDRWVWKAETQNPAAIELMLRLSHDDDRNVRYNAVYYGLSTVRKQDERVVRRLMEMAFADREPNLYGRIAWGLRTDRERVALLLQDYMAGDDRQRAKHAREVYKELTGMEPPAARE